MLENQDCFHVARCCYIGRVPTELFFKECLQDSPRRTEKTPPQSVVAPSRENTSSASRSPLSPFSWPDFNLNGQGLTKFAYIESLIGKGTHEKTPELEALITSGMSCFGQAVDLHEDTERSEVRPSPLRLWEGGVRQLAEAWHRVAGCMQFRWSLLLNHLVLHDWIPAFPFRSCKPSAPSRLD